VISSDRDHGSWFASAGALISTQCKGAHPLPPGFNCGGAARRGRKYEILASRDGTPIHREPQSTAPVSRCRLPSPGPDLPVSCEGLPQNHTRLPRLVRESVETWKWQTVYRHPAAETVVGMDIARMQAALMLESGIGHRRIWAAGRRPLAVIKFTPGIRSRKKSGTRVRAAAGTPGSGQSQADRQTAGREPIKAHGMERSRSSLLRPVSSLRCGGCAE
jgi:hypothetical protein